ncbi:hypothetical protein [Streptomyces capuensis]|uniref:hypothetical protein n=1 Tax=Streptomyces capuensis TaxID=1464056 RepID=UPI0004BEDFFD|nr:hypothetical protein [Streptomyces capuensis]
MTTTSKLSPVTGLRTHLAEALAETAMTVLAAYTDTLEQGWMLRGGYLRDCTIPGCHATFDLRAAWTGKSAEPGREPDGWRQSQAAGYLCPQHAQALGGDGTGPHLPTWYYRDHADKEHGGAALVCSCGWDAGPTRFRGHGTVLWQVHALEVLEIGEAA